MAIKVDSGLHEKLMNRFFHKSNKLEGNLRRKWQYCQIGGFRGEQTRSAVTNRLVHDFGDANWKNVTSKYRIRDSESGSAVDPNRYRKKYIRISQ